MARDISDIKQEITDQFMANTAVQELYGLTSSDTFDGKFSKVSIESLIFYIISFGIWVLEKMYDTHISDVDTMLAERLPHTTRWYRNLVLNFCPDTEDDAPVKYCSVDDHGCRLKIKIAGGSPGARQPVTPEQKAAVEAYLANEKDAGLKITVINEQSDRMSVWLKVWYDPIKLVPSDKPVEAALKAYVSNLDFDGLMSRNSLVDAIREVPGVEMVEIVRLKTKYANNAWEDFGIQKRAESGYWTVSDEGLRVQYERYRKENL